MFQNRILNFSKMSLKICDHQTITWCLNHKIYSISNTRHIFFHSSNRIYLFRLFDYFEIHQQTCFQMQTKKSQNNVSFRTQIFLHTYLHSTTSPSQNHVINYLSMNQYICIHQKTSKCLSHWLSYLSISQYNNHQY